jgi:hypothetical protein
MSENNDKRKKNKSKYESLYQKSVVSALSNNKTKDKKSTTRKLSDYNKFIKEHSSKFTGPDRLKKLSKMWKKVKADKSESKDKITFVSKSETKRSRARKRSKSQLNNIKNKTSVKKTDDEKKSNKKETITKSKKSNNKDINKSKELVNKRSRVSKKTTIRNVEKKDRNKLSAKKDNKSRTEIEQNTKPKKLRFFNYVEK